MTDTPRTDLRAAVERYQRAYHRVHSAYDGECEHGFMPASQCPNTGCPDRELAEAWAAVRAHRCIPDEATLAEALADELMKAGYDRRFYTANGREHTRTDAAGYAAAIIARLRESSDD
jgi:hypothetical protein